ncbi:MAG: WecB/TagA/CpsF family glycosyltransferase [Elusimicrobia bacterium]|nr:WecB/TagA/CpsF family glycosyltransferase [Elusimicrobiota bacterium]
MTPSSKSSVLGVLIDSVTMDRAVGAVVHAAQAGVPFRVTALAVHGVMCGRADPAMRYRLNRFDLALPDGQPVRWALNLLHGRRLAERVYGPHLVMAVCRETARRGVPVAFFGSTADDLSRLSARLCAEVPGLRIAALEPSRFAAVDQETERALVERLKASGARLVFCGLGCPRQEVWAWENAGALGMPVLAVGAAFRFLAGSLPMAPPWMQRTGLEWLFRLASEPRRLWPRYLLLNPLYIWHLLRQAAGWRPPQDGGGEPPRLRYG